MASYEYDWRGLRTRKVTTGKMERYYYDGDDLAYITDDNNKLKYLFVRDTNGRLLYMTDYSNYPTTVAKTYIYLHDSHGNVVALVDSSGSRIVNYQYDAWGMLINTPESGPKTAIGESLWTANPFLYSGYQRDSETGLYYLKARYYSTSLGRFLSRDVILSVNRYAYAGNNPVNFVDPRGLLLIVDDDTVMMPSGKIVNRRTGRVVSNSKIKDKNKAQDFFYGTKIISGPVTSKGLYFEGDKPNLTIAGRNYAINDGNYIGAESSLLSGDLSAASGIVAVEGEHRYVGWSLSGVKASAGAGLSLTERKAELYGKVALVEASVTGKYRYGRIAH